MTDIQDVISPKLANAIANPIFPAVDSLLRSGRHISTDQLDNHAFLMDFQNELDGFYRRYNVELIRAPEGFFYLRPKATTLIARSADEGKLLKAVNQRSSGSDLDKQKLAEKVRAAIGRLRRLGMIHTVGEQHSGKFTISESVFRFGAEVRSGDDPLEAQARLIRDGEAATPQSLELEKQAKAASHADDLDDEESAVEIDEEFDDAGEQE